MNGTRATGRHGPEEELRITVYSDPGHAWGAVPVALLTALGIEGQISAYSYLDPRSGTAYLEEDCDLPRFVQAARARGITVTWEERHLDAPCFVRGLPRYRNGVERKG